MVNIVDLVNQVKALAEEIDLDAKKCDAGNRQAGIRVRKGMLEVIVLAKETREAVINLRT
jgi:hypothetical protein